MSVQLIIKPQNVQGFTNVTSYINENVVSNGINFTGLNSSGSYTASGFYDFEDVILNAYPSTPNVWYRFSTDDNNTAPAIPTLINQNVLISLVATSGSVGAPSGIYQRLTGLVVGQTYEVEITKLVPETNPQNFWEIYIFNQNGSLLDYGVQVADNNSTATFTAQSVNDDIFFISYNYTPQTATIQLTNVSIIGATELVNTLSGDGSVLCDLYEDEDLPLSLSVDDFKNVAEKVQSYSKAFNLPATKRNNRIFDNVFEITRADDGIIFNAYRRTQCVLKQDGFILFEGFLRLLDVSDKEGEISFNVNLYSEVIALADVLKDRTFSDLGFNELEHAYQITNIKNSWNDTGTGITYINPSTSGFRDANSTVKYPLCNWNNQFVISNGSTPGSFPNRMELTILEQGFRPFINIKYLIDRIFANPDVPFTYTSNFFNSSDFLELYMDFNWGSDGIAVQEDNGGQGRTGTANSVVTTSSTFTTIPIDINDYPASVGYATGGVFTATLNNQTYSIDSLWRFKRPQVTLPNLGDYTMRWLHTSAATGVETIYGELTTNLDVSSSGDDWSVQFVLEMDAGDTLKAEAATDNGTLTVFDLAGTSGTLSDIGDERVLVDVSGLNYSSNEIGQTLRGELGQWEFLKGLMTMFNLITLVDEDNPNTIKIEPYSDIFINNPNSVQHDWTERIDVSEMKLTPLTDLNKNTIFKFVEDEDDSANQQYKKQLQGYLYGSYEKSAGDSFNILDGKEEIIAEPFANTIVKGWSSYFGMNYPMPQIYAMNEDGESEGFDNSPRIMFNNGIKNIASSYFIPEQNGGSSSQESSYLLFSHFTDVPVVVTTATPLPTDTRDFNFDTQQHFIGGASPVNNLYGLYWKPYFDELYNPDTRTMTIKVNLSAADINTFKFSDKVFLKNRTFRVNKIDYKPNDLATVEFILIP